MRVVGVPSPLAPPVVSFTIAHGKHPNRELFAAGYVPVQPLSAALVDGEIVFTYVVRGVNRSDRRPRRRRVVHEEPGSTETPIARQRVGAYALVLSERGLLGTVHSKLTGAPGTWALPGGGVDDGESPAEAVLREIHEETGQHAQLHRVIALESEHWIGRSVSGTLEDFHALRIIYAASCQNPSDPRVVDLGGSTARADWVSVKAWRKLRWTVSSRALLARYASELSSTQFLK